MRNIIVYFGLLLIGCQNKPISLNQIPSIVSDSIVLSLEVQQTSVLSQVPSASGVTVFGTNYWVIGDDSPFLFQLNKQLQLIDKSAIYSTEQVLNGRIGHTSKPDFEAIEHLENKKFLIMASGSYSPQRDLCVVVDLEADTMIQTYVLSAFYEYLKKDSLLLGHEFNLEGLALANGNLYFFNRGQNLIFSLSKNDFFEYLVDNSELPEYRVQKYNLPKLDSLSAGFSGATYCEPWKKLIFTASYESSPNAYNDGAILGSLVGVIDLNQGDLSLDYDYTPIPENNDPLKIESVAIDSIISEKQVQLVFVSDSDGGDSHFVKSILSIQ